MNIAIVPAGQWGSALAIPLLENGHTVRFWMRTPEQADAFQTNRVHPRFPGFRFSEAITVCAKLEETLIGADIVILACSSQGLRETAELLRNHLASETIVLSVIKGFERETHLRPSEVLHDILPHAAHRIAVLSGPNFAGEVTIRKQTATVIGSRDIELAKVLKTVFSTPVFHVHTTQDVVGAELGGALKNIIAMAAGIIDGSQGGENARAALITRGFEEMCRLAEAYGAHHSTLYGLSGLGDLLLSSTGEKSRNHRFGTLFAQGEQFPGETVEGIYSLHSAVYLAAAKLIDVPITTTLHRLVTTGEHTNAVEQLLAAARTL